MLVLFALAAGMLGAPATPPLTLADALAQAREASPLRDAAARLATGAEDAGRRAGRLPNPQIDLRVENLWPDGPGLSKDVFAVVNQTLELGGKRRLRRALTLSESGVAAAQLGLADWSVAGRVVDVYLDALRARRRVEVLDASRADLTTAAQVMARRLAEGLVAEADALKVRTDLARVDLDLVRARLDEDQRLIELAYLIGAPERIDAARLIEPLVLTSPPGEAAATAAGLARHPDLRAATARVARARQALSLEQARRTPDALVTGGYKRTAGLNSGVAAVLMTLPIFDRNGVATAKAGGDLRAAEAEEAALTRRLVAEVESTRIAARSLADRAAAVGRDLVGPAESVRAAAVAALNEGQVDVLRLLDAERVLREARHLETDARLDAVGAAIAARMAAGEEPLP